MEIKIELSDEQLGEVARQLKAARLPELRDREAEMVEQMGEACAFRTAARTISVGMDKLQTMLMDGRLRFACGKTRVDVRSLARYIEHGNEMDEQAAYNRRVKRQGFVGV